MPDGLSASRSVPERQGHLDLEPVVNRSLSEAWTHIGGKRRRRNGVGVAMRRSIPVRTFADSRDPPPSFFELDMVEHCGGQKTDGNFAHTLMLTASGGTEGVAMPVRGQSLSVGAMTAVAGVPPLAILGIDTDNDSAFMNQTVFDDFQAKGFEQTRSRAYKKNDQA